ncbi:MAG TPA: RecX family transcriptional regulator [Rhizobacter sp.]|nr:RecX family transcriptional regulator [Rhizobacter sp.]
MPRLSLKGCGIQLLSQREHSRAELRRKLMAHALAAAEPSAKTEMAQPSAEQGAEQATPAEQVEAVLDWLQAQHYLSEERFVESRVHARRSRFGNVRIRHELAQHGVTLEPEAAQRLKETELARARNVWQHKYGRLASDAHERARQARFLAGRGFSPEVIRRVVQGLDDE